MQAPRQRRLTAGRLARLALAVVIGIVLGLGIDVARSGGLTQAAVTLRQRGYPLLAERYTSRAAAASAAR